MVPTKWCGAHYCTALDQCDEKRAEGNDKFCRDHICLEPGCAGGKVSGGHFCLDHTCKTDGCQVRRERDAEHCGSHVCRVEDCVRPAAANRRCDNHRRCTVESCKEWIYIEHGPDGDIKWPECEHREHLPPPPPPSLSLSPSLPLSFFLSSSSDTALLTVDPLTPPIDHRPRCAATTLANTPCDKRILLPPHTGPGAAPAARYCADHSCSFRACPNARPLDSLQFCSAHKCGVATCQDQVKHALALGLGSAAPPLLLQTRLLLAAGGAGAGVGGGLWGMVGGKFCAAHSCLGDGGKCGAEVVGDDDDEGVGGGCGADGRTGRWRRARRGGAGGEEAKRFCQRHECSHRGCCAEATHHSRRGRRGGMCDRHYRRRREGRGGGAGPFGAVGMPPMGMMPGFPPFFGGGGSYYESSGDSSDSENGRGPGDLLFGGPYF